MQFTKRLRAGVRAGEISCSIRIWQSARVKRGGRYPVEGGAIEVDSIKQIELSDITPALARASGFESVVELLKIAKHGAGNNVYLVRFHFVAPVTVKRPARGVPKTQSTSQRKQLQKIVDRLPEAKAVAQGHHLSLEVRKKRFGWFLDDHHGDGRIALNCKSSAETREALEKLAPKQVHVPKYLDNKGWIGMWLDTPKINWSAVELALHEACRRTAPKALLRDYESRN